MNNLRDQMTSGATWMIGFRLAERGVGLISTLVLARLLVPHDFGVVAMAMSFVALLELITAFGFDVVLIQKAGNDRKQWDTAWTFGIIFGLIVAAIMVLAAGPVAAFYRTTELESILRVLAIGSIMQGFTNIGVVAFRKEMRFDLEFWFMFSKKISGFLVTIPAAIILESYWALVIGQMTTRMTEVAMSYFMHPYRPRVSLAAAADLLGYSRWLVAGNIVGYIRDRSSDWILGRVSGAHALGSYNIGAEVAALPSTELLAPVNRALIPAYAKIVQSGGDLRGEYLSVLSIISLVGLPAVIGLGAVAPVLVPVALGDRWADVVPVLMILAFAGVAKVLTGNLYPAYFAMNRPDLTFKVGVVSAGLALAGLLIVVPRHGLIGAAAVMAAANLAVMPWSLLLAIRLLGSSVGEVSAVVWRPLFAAAIMGWVVFMQVRRINVGEADIVNLFATIGLGVFVYTFLVVALWVISGKPDAGESMLWRKTKSYIQARRK